MVVAIVVVADAKLLVEAKNKIAGGDLDGIHEGFGSEIELAITFLEEAFQPSHLLGLLVELGVNFFNLGLKSLHSPAGFFLTLTLSLFPPLDLQTLFLYSVV